jgi:hypothetical protein
MTEQPTNPAAALENLAAQTQTQQTNSALENLAAQTQQVNSVPVVSTASGEPVVHQQQVPTPNAIPQQAPVGEDFLGDLGLADVPDQIADGKYPAVLFSGHAGTFEKKDGSGNARKISFKWRVDYPGSPFNGEMLDDFCAIEAGADNRAKRRIRDRLMAIGVPLSGVGNHDQLNALFNSKKGMPVWIEVFKNKAGFVNISDVAIRDASIQGQMTQQAHQIHQNLRDVVTTPTGAPSPQSSPDY